MKNSSIFFVALGIIFISIFSCEKWNLDQKDFLQVEITSIEPLSIDSVRISGQIRDLAVGQVQDHGFIWTTREEEPLIFSNEGHRALGVMTQIDDQFFTAILKLSPNTRYTLRTYATLNKEEYIYSESSELRTGNGKVFTLNVNYERALSLEVSGRLSNTEKGIVAIKHGFCWSTINPQPTLDDNAVNLGDRSNNEVFTATIDGLQNGILHYYRAYAILSHNFKLDTVFGQVLSFDGDLNFWTRKADFGGGPRSEAVGFSIDQKGYIGLGRLTGGPKVKDFWEYNPQSDTWTQRADFGGGPRTLAVGFSIDHKGYIGTGIDGNNMRSNDFWEYNPQSDTWTKRADFGGGPRSGAVGFSINQKGYIGTGGTANDFFSDFWEYDPGANSWTPRADFGGGWRYNAVGFSIDQKGYIGTGMGNRTVLGKNDLWEYNPQNNSWTQKADFGGEERFNAVGFSIGNKGFIGAGFSSGKRVNDFWEYDPLNDIWTQRTDISPGGESGTIGFSIGQKGYMGLGLLDGQWGKGFWEYDP